MRPDRWRERIPDSSFTFTYTRSGGPGGQNVNKVATRATLWFDLTGTTVLEPYEKERLRSKLGGRINADGWLHVTSMKHRTQAANRRACIERFHELIANALTPVRLRRKTAVPSSARRRRLAEKRRRGEIKKLRQSDSGID